MPRDNEPGQPKPRNGKTSGSGKWSHYGSTRGKPEADWGSVDAALLLDAVRAITSAGDAVLLGVTRSGGTLVCTVCSGEERLKLYATSVEEMEQHLKGLVDYVNSQ